MPFIVPNPAPAPALEPAGSPVDLPQFDVPFRLDNTGQVVVVEQDSPAEIGAAIYNVLTCLQGQKLNDPDFGIPSPVFSALPLDLSGIEKAVNALEPRADTVALQRVISQVQAIIGVDVIAQVPGTSGAVVPDATPIPIGAFAPVTQFGAAAIASLSPWMTLHLAWLCDAIGAMIDPLYTLVQDVGLDDGVTPTVGTYVDGELVTDGYQPGYGVLLNPAACPAVDLPYLAQFAGVQLPAGADETTSRSLILAEAGRNRGTEAAVIAAAKRNLNGTQSVTYIARRYVDGTPDAGWAGLIMLESECPSLDAVKAAVRDVKFGGVMMWYQLVTGFTWAEQTETWSSDTRSWAQAAGEL